MSSLFPQHAGRAVSRYLEDLGSSRSLTVWLMAEYGEWDQLATLEIDPGHYLSAEEFWRDASATSLLKKYPLLPTSFDKEKVAEDTFLDCERQCCRSNVRLAGLEEGYSNADFPIPLHAYFARARKYASLILGACPSLVEGRFGPGATFADRGFLTTIPDKMTSAPTLTPDACSFVMQWHLTAWSKAVSTSGRPPVLVRGNRFASVPKDAKRNRAIAMEPSINVFYQLGYGRVIRSRLLAWGIDLSNGQEIHRRLACMSSLTGHLATLDLTNASDTICSRLVKLLLPKRWFRVLDDLRSKSTLFKGRFHRLEKFSSMGNGFTFELETLIFLCLSLAAMEGGLAHLGRDVFAYGDDLIVPSESAKDVISALAFCGLTVNKSKSFWTGSFRESCGGDFFNGVDVRPFQLKKPLSEPQELIAFANGLRQRGNSLSRRLCTFRAWCTILDGLPTHIRRLRGPEALGDLVIHDDESSQWQTRWSHGIRYVRVYRPATYRKVSWRHFGPDVTLASALYGVPWNEGEIIPRDSVTGYRIGWVPYS